MSEFIIRLEDVGLRDEVRDLRNRFYDLEYRFLKLAQRVDRLEHSWPTTAVLSLKGDLTMADGQITVDVTTETLTLDLVDDEGNDTGLPTGATVAYTGDNDAVATAAQDGTNPLLAHIGVTPGAGDVGIVNFTATVTLPDGSIIVSNAESIEVDPGAPVSARMTVASEAPTPPVSPPPAPTSPPPPTSPTPPSTVPPAPTSPPPPTTQPPAPTTQPPAPASPPPNPTTPTTTPPPPAPGTQPPSI